jgi:hypothetical protein
VKKYLVILCLPGLLLGQTYHFKKIAGNYPIGNHFSPVILFDSNNDGRPDLTTALLCRNWQVWEYTSLGTFESAYDACQHWTGKWATGDVDQDGLTDRLESGTDSLEQMLLVLTYESPDRTSYPTAINWLLPVRSEERTCWFSYFPGDLDGDGHREILFIRTDTLPGYTILENRGDNNNQIVWRGQPYPDGGPAQAIGDFDQDGRMDFASATGSSNNWVSVFENTGNDQYHVVFQDSITLPNGDFDAFSGNDVNGNGKPEFFINFLQCLGGDLVKFHLYMWEATGDNQYQRICVDSSTTGRCFGGFIRSQCADVDGDGIEEVIQAAGSQVQIYKYLDGRFRRIGGYGYGNLSTCINCADINGDGYNEIIISGDDPRPKTDVLEIEAVRVRYPNGGETFTAGTQQPVRWSVFQPPRCDSLSLSYSTDNGRTFTPIRTGLPGSDTACDWTVPDTPSDSCLARVTAYGPGWQHDESNACFSIQAGGVEENVGATPEATGLIDVSPNPFRDRVRVRFSIGAGKPLLPGRNRRSDFQVAIMDVSGRTVATLANGPLTPGCYDLTWDAHAMPPGVYFLCFSGSEHQETRKLLLTR